MHLRAFAPRGLGRADTMTSQHKWSWWCAL